MTPKIFPLITTNNGALGLHKQVRSPQLRCKTKPGPRSQRAAGLSVVCTHREGLASRNGDTKERSGAPFRDSLHPSYLPLPRGAPPGDPSSNLRLTRVLRRPLSGRPPDHSETQSTERDWGLLLVHATTTSLDQEKEATAAAAASARGSENRDRPLAAGEAPFGPAPLPGAPRSPLRPSPRAPPARPMVACGRTSAKSSLTTRDSGRWGVASGR